MPLRFKDISNFRQVPDTQEVFVDEETDQVRGWCVNVFGDKIRECTHSRHTVHILHKKLRIQQHNTVYPPVKIFNNLPEHHPWIAWVSRQCSWYVHPYAFVRLCTLHSLSLSIYIYNVYIRTGEITDSDSAKFYFQNLTQANEDEAIGPSAEEHNHSRIILSNI